ncbi:MAG: hypothetical protein IKW59_05770 [Clostridia bacterium]|nr:hypothetical protein [Clostridia bacterium]
MNAGRAAYIKRNCEMIDKSDICIIYFKQNYAHNGRKSGTAIAYQYAAGKKKTIINLAESF